MSSISSSSRASFGTSSSSQPGSAASMDSLRRAAQFAGHATVCAYSGSADFLEPDYARWRASRRRMILAPVLIVVVAIGLLLLVL